MLGLVNFNGFLRSYFHRDSGICESLQHESNMPLGLLSGSGLFDSQRPFEGSRVHVAGKVNRAFTVLFDPLTFVPRLCIAPLPELHFTLIQMPLLNMFLQIKFKILLVEM